MLSPAYSKISTEFPSKSSAIAGAPVTPSHGSDGSVPTTTLPFVVTVGSAGKPVIVNPYWIINPVVNSAAVADTIKGPAVVISVVLFTTVA